jgi:hypothetical protein
MQPCKIYVAQVGQRSANDVSDKMLDDPSARSADHAGLFDPRGMFAAHRWVQRALQSHPWRVFNRSEADVVYFNASLTYRHQWRYTAMALLRREAASIANGTSGCNKRPELFATAMVAYYKLRDPTRDSSLHWITAFRTSRNDVIAPQCITTPAWLVNGQEPPESPARVQWASRKLLFFAGHIPRLYLSPLRFLIWAQIHADPRATVVQSTLWMHLVTFKTCSDAPHRIHHTAAHLHSHAPFPNSHFMVLRSTALSRSQCLR